MNNEAVSCDRCGKTNLHKDGVHTCTPNRAWLTKENAEKDKAIKELASALDELIVDFWGSTGKGGLYDKCRTLANKYLDKD